MSKKTRGLIVFAWIAVWVFWVVTTRHFHPTLGLALIVTTSLVVAYAAAVQINHGVLLPRYWRQGRHFFYVTWLVVAMLTFTALALVTLRTFYIAQIGRERVGDALQHFVIDLFGMVVHVAAAALIVRMYRRFARK